MADLPVEIPPSLSSYVEQFETDPEKSTERLEAHLKKRGMDAVGHFLLAWFYYQQGEKKRALDNAVKAKCYAPGSPLLEHLHYYLIHPKRFQADIPEAAPSAEEPFYQNDKNVDFVLNLESLISKLSAGDSLKVDVSPEAGKADKDLSLPAQMVSDIASETLAKIYEKQGKYEQAIEALQTMQKVKPKYADKYQEDIERIRKLGESTEE